MARPPAGSFREAGGRGGPSHAPTRLGAAGPKPSSLRLGKLGRGTSGSKMAYGPGATGDRTPSRGEERKGQRGIALRGRSCSEAGPNGDPARSWPTLNEGAGKERGWANVEGRLGRDGVSCRKRWTEEGRETGRERGRLREV
jgi:hypothetical protein